MDEERLRARRELIQQARQGKITSRKKNPPSAGKQFFLFRIYVTMMLVGTAIVLSLFDTNTANTITESLKEAIAYEMPLETMQQWKQKAISVFEQKASEKGQQQTQDNTQTQQQTQNNTQVQTQQQQTQYNTQTQQQNTTEKGNTFQPDLSEDSGKIP